MKLKFEYLYDMKKNETYIMIWTGMVLIHSEIQSGPLNKKEKELYEKQINAAQSDVKKSGRSKTS